MDDKTKKLIIETDLEEILGVLIEHHCFSPVVEAIVCIMQTKLSKLEKLEGLIQRLHEESSE